MRDIKFRVWDDEYNCYWYKCLIGNSSDKDFELQTSNAVYVTSDKVDYDIPNGGQWVNFDDKDSMVIEQFTGLTDKNGTDIYEGDILLNDNKCYGKTYVQVEYMLDKTGFTSFGTRFATVLGNCASEIYEVAGNIHQDPELLGQ